MNIPKIVFIVPYRNRPHHKTHFSIYMQYILEDLPKNTYEIYFSHQCDERPFNRGGMKNIGFLAIKDKYPDNYKDITFVFNDIDTIPCQKNILNYETKKGIIKHFYGYKFALGGIFSIKGEDFEKINGFPSLWGWGIEDNTINQRALNYLLMIDRSTFFTIGNEEIMQVLDKPYKLIADKDASRINSFDGINTIKNLEYEFKDDYINVTNFETSFPLDQEKMYTEDVSRPGLLAKSGLMEDYEKKMTYQNRWGLGGMGRPLPKPPGVQNQKYQSPNIPGLNINRRPTANRYR